MTTNTNRAPEYAQDLLPLDRAAAHPSIQRQTTDELRSTLATLKEDYANDALLPECDDKRLLMESTLWRIEVYERALEWRT